MFLQEKTVLVAGGAGFIGSRLCRNLLKSGYKVMCVDNISTGRRENMADLESDPNFSFFEHDINTPINYKKHIFWIFNLACGFTAGDCTQSPQLIIETLSNGVKNLLNLAVEKGSVFVHISSSEVYGEPLVVPQPESYWGNVDPVGLRSCFQEGSRFAESLIATYRKKNNLSLKIARIFNVYGPVMRLDGGSILASFLSDALQKRNIRLPENSVTSSWCFVNDFVRGLILLVQAKHDGPINLGHPTPIDSGTIADSIASLTGVGVVPGQIPILYPSNLIPDISLAQKELSWEPEVSLDEGLKQTLAFYR